MRLVDADNLKETYIDNAEYMGYDTEDGGFLSILNLLDFAPTISIQDTRANETLVANYEKDAALKDRKLFVHNLGVLLSQTRERIVGCELDNNEIVTVMFKNGYTKEINVNMDSYFAIIRDVTKCVLL